MANDGGPAFPNLKANSCGPKTAGEAGMSLRDYFAASALQAIIAKWPPISGWAVDKEARSCAAGAYTYADAMIAEREKRNA